MSFPMDNANNCFKYHPVNNETGKITFIFRRMLYNHSKGRLKAEGEIIKRPKLARYLERVAADPLGAVNGSLLKEMADDLKAVGSIITFKDLTDYQPIWRDPVEMPLRSRGNEPHFRLFTAPPPASGVLVGLALNALSR